MKNLLSKYSFFIAFYSHKINGKRIALSPAQPLLDYLIQNQARLIAFIDQPVPLSNHPCALEVYRTYGKSEQFNLPKVLSFLNEISEKKKKRGGTVFKHKIRDLISVVYFTFKYRQRFDFFIGSESINTLAGIFLKKLGFFKYVIYYVIDLAPERYNNKLVNWLYLKLDKFCSYYSDFVWNNSPAYEKLRIKDLNYRKNKMAKQVNLLYGVDFDYITILPEDKLINQVVFNGSIDIENGIELIIDAIPEVIKEIPGVKFKLIGGGPMEEIIRQKINTLNLSETVEITGYFFDRKKIREEFCRSKVGLAIYPRIKYSIKPYGDPIKFREYMACGLGIVTDLNKESVAQAITKILRDSEFFRLCRKNVLTTARETTWLKIFNRAFTEMGLN